MISAILKGYLVYRNDGMWCLMEKSSSYLGLKKGVFLTKFFFYIKRSMVILERDYFIFIKKHHP